MNSNNILNIGSGSTGITQTIGTNNTTLATTEFVIANQGVPSSNYAQLSQTSGTLQTFTTPINFSGTTTGVTQPVNTNNTTLATTAFVTTNGPIYTTSTFTNNYSPQYIALTPSTVSVISTYIAQTNVVYFNNVNFSIYISGNPLFLTYLCVLNFNVNPFPNSPPNPTTGSINVLYNNTNTVVTTTYVWTANTLYIAFPSSLVPNYNNTAFTLNLQNLGAFQA